MLNFLTMKTIYLIRHCKALGQEQDASLTEEWIEQSFKLADFLRDKDIEEIVSSTYKRAIQTIQPLSDILWIRIKTDKRLMEKILSSQSMDDWMDKLRLSFENPDLVYDGWESSLVAMNRWVEVIKEILNGTMSKVAVVTHGALLTLILHYFDRKIGFDEWKSLGNPCVYELIYSLNEVSLAEINL